MESFVLEKSLEGLDPLARCANPVDVGCAPLSPVCGAEAGQGCFVLLGLSSAAAGVGTRPCSEQLAQEWNPHPSPGFRDPCSRARGQQDPHTSQGLTSANVKWEYICECLSVNTFVNVCL